MTLSTVGFGRSFPRAWIVPIGVLIVAFGLAVLGVFSRSIAADFLAWWPVWVAVAIAAVILRHRTFGQFRAAGLVPLVATALTLLFVIGHLAGWAIMPSASQRLVGPATEGTATASLTANIDGALEVVGVDQPNLYLVGPAREGGQIGVPQASEETQGESTAVELIEPAEPGIYAFAGWDISLAAAPTWTVSLFGAIDADLRLLDLSGGDFDGSGTVRLGASSDRAIVTVSGDFELIIPEGAPASVTGVASVPDTWILTEGGAESAVGSDGGWDIVVTEGATVRISEQ